MSLSTRRRVGLLLACISGAALIVALMFFSHLRVVGSGSSDTGTWTAVAVEVATGWGFLLPVFCGAVGLLLFAWPSRKPPKLPEGGS